MAPSKSARPVQDFSDEELTSELARRKTAKHTADQACCSARILAPEQVVGMTGVRPGPGYVFVEFTRGSGSTSTLLFTEECARGLGLIR